MKSIILDLQSGFMGVRDFGKIHGFDLQSMSVREIILKLKEMIKLNFFPDVDEHDFTIWVTSSAVFVCYWIFSIGFLCLDLTGSLRKYKIQPGKNDPLDKQKLIGVKVHNNELTMYKKQAFSVSIHSYVQSNYNFDNIHQWYILAVSDKAGSA